MLEFFWRSSGVKKLGRNLFRVNPHILIFSFSNLSVLNGLYGMVVYRMKWDEIG